MDVAVYCASSNRVPERFFAVAERLGEALAAGGHTLLFGGGDIGLMGALARSVHEHGGRVVGVIPRALRDIEGIAYDVADEMIVTESMQARKRLLFTRANAFLMLPGGLGTLEEFAEVATLRKLGMLSAPIGIVNAYGFFDTLLAFFGETTSLGFSPPLDYLYFVSATAEDAVAHLESLQP